jgi:hypothetical protein
MGTNVAIRDCATSSPLGQAASGYLYSVLFQDRLLVSRSKDPECDAARALLAQGVTGKLTMLDGKTGRPRTIIDIEKAARLRVAEESRDGIRFRKLTPAETPDTADGTTHGCLERPSS